ncbi:MAG: cation:proton antiporter [Myxococcales bacterium]|nr:cation:proton antiporter [Myxococcales bacterium]
MEILYVLLVLLIATRTFGEIAVRIGQPALVGELLAGVLIGVVVTQHAGIFPVLADLPESRVFGAITDLGIFFLMLMAGLELRPRKLAEASGLAVVVAIGGLALPLATGIAVGWWWLPASELHTAQSLFLGVALAITAVPVSVGVLLSLGRLDSPVGRVIVSAALVDDVLSLLLLALLTAVLQTGSIPDVGAILALLGKVALYFAIAVPAGLYVFPWLGRRIVALQGDEFEFSFLVLAGLAYSVLAEALSIHFLIGAFLAGLFFVRRTIDEATYDDVFAKVSALTHGFFAPVFFASIGIHLEGGAILETPAFLATLVLVATAGKVVGAGVPARLGGMSPSDALAVGVGMNARGAVELIVADVAFRAGLFAQPESSPIVDSLYSGVVVTAIATTLATPIGLKALFRRGASRAGNDP